MVCFGTRTKLCFVCLDDLFEGKDEFLDGRIPVAYKACGHAFHKTCADATIAFQMETNRTGREEWQCVNCPYCRTCDPLCDKGRCDDLCPTPYVRLFIQEDDDVLVNPVGKVIDPKTARICHLSKLAHDSGLEVEKLRAKLEERIQDYETDGFWGDGDQKVHCNLWRSANELNRLVAEVQGETALESFESYVQRIETVIAQLDEKRGCIKIMDSQAQTIAEFVDADQQNHINFHYMRGQFEAAKAILAQDLRDLRESREAERGRMTQEIAEERSKCKLLDQDLQSLKSALQQEREAANANGDELLQVREQLNSVTAKLSHERKAKRDLELKLDAHKFNAWDSTTIPSSSMSNHSGFSHAVVQNTPHCQPRQSYPSLHADSYQRDFGSTNLVRHAGPGQGRNARRAHFRAPLAQHQQQQKRRAPRELQLQISEFESKKRKLTKVDMEPEAAMPVVKKLSNPPTAKTPDMTQTTGACPNLASAGAITGKGRADEMYLQHGPISPFKKETGKVAVLGTYGCESLCRGGTESVELECQE